MAFNTRALAARTLMQVLQSDNTLEDCLPPPAPNLAPRDRALIHRLVANTLRFWPRVQAVLTQLCPRGLAPMPAAVLSIGLTELLWLDTPAHAATSEAVDAMASTPHFKGLVNAVLRRALREKDALLGSVAGVSLLPLLLQALPCNAAVAQTLLSTPAPLDLTAKNPNHAAALAEQVGGVLLPTGAIRLPEGAAVTELTGFAQGEFWVQNAAAALPMHALLAAFESTQGLRILDACAAPGGKTMQAAAAGADVTAVDISAGRLKTLRQNLERTQLTARITNANMLTLPAPEPLFDAVLLDAPCSALGTLRRHPELAQRNIEHRLQTMLPLQQQLLHHVAQQVRVGGILVYAVCSPLPREGALQVEDFLSRHTHYKRLPLLAAQYPCVTPAGDICIMPDAWAEHNGLDGFYIARLQRV